MHERLKTYNEETERKGEYTVGMNQTSDEEVKDGNACLMNEGIGRLHRKVVVTGQQNLKNG